jgi:hypothetical protein
MTDADREQAARQEDGRKRLLAAGGDVIPRAPWLHAAQPPAAVDLIQFATWQARISRPSDEDLLAALALLPAARAEVDQLEVALLSAARSRGFSWSRISLALGLRSPQAAQQRLGRVAGRSGTDQDGTAGDLPVRGFRSRAVSRVRRVSSRPRSPRHEPDSEPGSTLPTAIPATSREIQFREHLLATLGLLRGSDD